MTLWKAALKDIFSTLLLVLGHWLHRKFVQIKIDLFGKTKVRSMQLKLLIKREKHLIVAFQASVNSLQNYRALIKAGYDPDQLPAL